MLIGGKAFITVTRILFGVLLDDPCCHFDRIDKGGNKLSVVLKKIMFL